MNDAKRNELLRALGVDLPGHLLRAVETNDVLFERENGGLEAQEAAIEACGYWWERNWCYGRGEEYFLHKREWEREEGPFPTRLAALDWILKEKSND